MRSYYQKAVVFYTLCVADCYQNVIFGLRPAADPARGWDKGLSSLAVLETYTTIKLFKRYRAYRRACGSPLPLTSLCVFIL
jgi:hypothetical protein